MYIVYCTNVGAFCTSIECLGGHSTSGGGGGGGQFTLPHQSSLEMKVQCPICKRVLERVVSNPHNKTSTLAKVVTMVSLLRLRHLVHGEELKLTSEKVL